MKFKPSDCTWLKFIIMDKILNWFGIKTNGTELYKWKLVNANDFFESSIATSLYNKIIQNGLGITIDNKIVKTGEKYKNGYQRLIGIKKLVKLLRKLSDDEKKMWRSKKLYVPKEQLSPILTELREKYYNFAEDMLEDAQGKTIRKLKKENEYLGQVQSEFVQKERRARNLQIASENAYKFDKYTELIDAKAEYRKARRLAIVSSNEERLRYLSFLNVFDYIEYIEPKLLDMDDEDECRRCGDSDGHRCTLCGSYWCDNCMDHRLHYLACCDKGYRYLVTIRSSYGASSF